MKCIGHFKTSWEAFITVASLVQFTPYCPYFQCCIFFQKKKKEKHLEISLFYVCLPKILMIWSKVLKIYIERVWQNEIGDYGSFFALPPTHPPKKYWIPSFYTWVPKTIIVWGTVPKIWGETDWIFCHFGPFFKLWPS